MLKYEFSHVSLAGVKITIYALTVGEAWEMFEKRLNLAHYGIGITLPLTNWTCKEVK